VLLLVLAVFGFFVGFGLLAISDDVVQAWVAHPPTPVRMWACRSSCRCRTSCSRSRCSSSPSPGCTSPFYAVSDARYREQFFAELDDELARAVGVRAVYRAVQRGVRGEADSAGDQRH